MRRLPDGELRFFSPRGRRIDDVPAVPTVSEDAVRVLIERLAADGIRIDPMESLPEWDGSPIDVPWAVKASGSSRTS